MLYKLTIYIFTVKLVNLLCSVCFATGYIHSGEMKIIISVCCGCRGGGGPQLSDIERSLAGIAASFEDIRARLIAADR